MRTLAINTRLFFESARLSYIALFRWLSPPTYVASKLLMPLGQLLFFTLLGIYATDRDNSSFYVIGNAIQVVAVSGIFGVPMSVGDDRFTGVLPYLFGVPSSRLFIYLGRAIFHVLDGILGVLIALTLGTLIFGVDLSQANPLLLLLAIGITALATCGFGLLLGSLSLITVNALFVGNTFYFLLFAISGANIPIDDLPAWAQTLSDFIPITRGIAATREIIAGASLADVSSLLAGELLVGAVYALIGYGVFRWIEFKARQMGTLESF